MNGNDAADTLVNALGARGSGQLYRLVDPASAPERSLSLQELEACGVIRNPFFDHPRQRRLYLQPVAATPTSIRQMVGEEISSLPRRRTQPVAFCGWIFSHHARRGIVSYMEKRLSVSSPQGRPSLFRFYDPRVLERLEAVLQPAQLSVLLGPVDSWFYFDHRQRLREVSPHGEKRHLGKLTLTEAQWGAIKRIGEINRCLDAWNNLDIENKREASLAEIDELIAMAEQYGVRESRDILLFVQHGLFVTPGFYRHPVMQALLQSMSKDQGYTTLVESLTNRDWDRIARETEGEGSWA